MNVNLIQTIATYIGHFHPLVVHLPIGFVFFLFFLELIIWKTKNESFKKVRIVLTLFSFLSAAFAVVLGLLLALEGGYNPDLISKHTLTGYLFLFITLILFVLEWKLKNKKYFEKSYLCTVLSSIIVISLVGHYGGSLTHGEDYLSLSNLSHDKSAQKQKVEITDINQAVVFTDLVQPIIEQKCISCHNKGKMKGEFLMDSYEHIMKGGESGAVVIASNSAQSELVKLINLEPIEERAMPPKGKVPLTADEKALITWWIDAGASLDKKVADLKPEAAMMAILAKFGKGGNAHSTELPSLPEVAAANENAISEAKKLGINVVKVAQNTNMLDVRCIINKSDWNDKKTEALLKIKDQIYILDLSGTAITNKSLTVIGQMKAINSLMLQSTAITDEGMKSLAQLENIEYLNLYKTQISDQSILVMSKWKKMKKAYFWQSKMSVKGLEQLKSQLPELNASLGNNNYNL